MLLAQPVQHDRGAPGKGAASARDSGQLQAQPEVYELSLVTQPLLVPIRLHALPALMFGDFGFAAFFD
jgi:hypothetical protein